jgi:hypothetical protein
MKKFGLSLALCAALSLAVVPAMTTPADAAKSGKSSKSKKSKATKVEVTKQSNGTVPLSVSYFNSCANAGASWGWVVAPVAAVGCGAVWAGPVIFQSFFWRV